MLRYYLDLSEAEIAATMGISRGTVKSATSRALAAVGQTTQGGIMTEPEDLVRSTTAAIAGTVRDVPPLPPPPAQDERAAFAPPWRRGAPPARLARRRPPPPRSCWRSPRRW